MRLLFLLTLLFGVCDLLAQGAVKTETNDIHTVYGFKFGQPLNLPQCPAKEHDWDIDPLFTESKCYSPGSIFAKGDCMLLKGPEDTYLGKYNTACVVNGNLERVEFGTSGIETQDVYLKLLTKKYGSPSRVKTKSLTNEFGAKFEALEAAWDVTDIHVSFDSAEYDDIHSGKVIIETTVGRDNDPEVIAAKKRKIPSL